MRATISKSGIDFLKREEGLRLKPYLCSAKVPTIGIGSTFYENGVKVTLKDAPITEARAMQLAEHTANEFAKKLNVTVPLTENQVTAVISLAYNIGTAAFNGSTALKRINAKDTAANIKAAFMMWDKETVNGVKRSNPSLLNRRIREADLFNKK